MDYEGMKMNDTCKRILMGGVLLITATFSFYAGRQTAPSMLVRLDNARVTVTESTTPLGGKRESYVRPSDQILVFLDDAQYEAIEANGSVSKRSRKSGEIVWHTKGEVAPVLVNKGSAYRNLIIALK
jgi:hypothetical protein